MKIHCLFLVFMPTLFILSCGEKTSPEIVPTYSVGKLPFSDDTEASELRYPGGSNINSNSNNNAFLSGILRETTLEQLYRRPVFVITKSASSLAPGLIDIAYAASGIQSVLTDPNFTYIRSFLQSPLPKSAVIFDFGTFFNAKLLNHKVGQFVFPNDFHFSDFTRLVSASRLLPVVAVFDRKEFESLRFDHVFHLGNLAVHQEFIEPLLSTEAPAVVSPSK